MPLQDARMNLRPLTFPVLFLFLTVAAALAVQGADHPATTQAAATQPAVGDKAPDFTLKTIDGKAVQLSELTKSGPVAIVQLRGWVGYQCPLCTGQFADLRSHSKDFSAAGCRVVFIYPGPAADLKGHASDFLKGKAIPDGFEFVLDPGITFANAWGVRWNSSGETAYPSTFLVDKANTIQFKKVSKSHGGRASSEEILKALDAKEKKSDPKQ